MRHGPAVPTTPAVLCRALRRAPGERRDRVRRRLWRVLRHAMRTELNAERLRRAGVRPDRLDAIDPLRALRALRPIAKAELRDAGAAALRDGRTRRSWRSSLSSGSTGEPVRRYLSPRAWLLLKYWVKLRARRACGVSPAERMAVLDVLAVGAEGGTPLERIGRLRRISVLQPAGAVARKLRTFRPAAVMGLPSALLDAGGALEHPPRGLRRVFTGGELLTGSARKALSGFYGTEPLDVYGTTETKEIAWECPNGSLHINADVLFVEILDDHGRPVDRGEEGDVVVTDLVDTAMPLLRYRVGDRAILPTDGCGCPVRLPCLRVVTGRDADALEIAGRRISPYRVTTALETVDDLRRYQVRQVGHARLQVRTEIRPAADASSVAACIRNALRDALPGPPAVDVRFTDRFESGPGGKTRIVEPLDAVPARAGSAAPEDGKA